MFLACLTLFAALCLSVTAAGFSVYGLVALFPGAAISIILMGSAIEFAKVVTAYWLHRNSNNTKLKRSMKYYMLFGVAVMMLLTSTGIFGYLSQAHLEFAAPSELTEIQMNRIQDQINLEQKTIDSSTKQLEMLDKSLDVYFKNDKATAGLAARKNQASERKELAESIKNSQKNISELQDKLLPLKEKVAENSVKLGPLKFVAELIYSNYEQHAGEAIRIIIILIIFIFDPMAILLVLAAGISFSDYYEKKNAKKSDTKNIMPPFYEEIKSEVNSENKEKNVDMPASVSILENIKADEIKDQESVEIENTELVNNVTNEEQVESSKVIQPKNDSPENNPNLIEDPGPFIPKEQFINTQSENISDKKVDLQNEKQYSHIMPWGFGTH